MKETVESIQQTLDQILEVSKGVSEALLNWKPAEDKWSIKEVLCHVNEAIPYWLDEVTKLIDKPGVEWGRGLQDEQRLAALAKANSRSFDEVVTAIEASKKQVQLVLSPITETQLQQESPSRNPRFGTKPLSFVIDHLLVEHVIVHLKQIQRNIEQFQQSN